MKTFKFIIKGTIIWFIIFTVVMITSGIDGIVDKYSMSNTLIAMLILGSFISICYSVISYEVLKIVTEYDILNKMLSSKKDE